MQTFDDGPAALPDGWEEENAGISGPLYEFVDALFELNRRGFFRRQACNPCSHIAVFVAVR